MCRQSPLFVILAACLFAAPAFANDTTLNVNVDPPRQLDGYEAPPIRMAAEHITVHFGEAECQVEVEFTFVNLSDEPVYCWAGFPDEDLLKAWMFYGPADQQGNLPDYTFGGEELWGDYGGRSLDEGAISHFASWTRQANDNMALRQPLATKLVRIERIAYEPDAVDSLGAAWHRRDDTEFNRLMFCHVFPINLEARDTMVVGHSYTTLTGSNVEQQHLFNYTLGTGRTWQGTIGEAKIDVYLEDGLTLQDLQFRDTPEFYGAVTSPAEVDWQRVAADHLQLVWTDFEPAGGQGYIMLATRPEAQPSSE
jgi:hypothetical protein